MRLYLVPFLSIAAGLAGCSAPVSQQAPIYLQGSLKDEAPRTARTTETPAARPARKADAPRIEQAAVSPPPKAARASAPSAPVVTVAPAAKPPAVPVKASPAPAAVPAAAVPGPAAAVCAAGSPCAAELQKLLADQTRAWIQTRVTASSYAIGARPTAYRQLRTSLTCKELAQAVEEIVEADEALQSPPLDVSDTQVARIRALGRDVANELKNDHAMRC